MTDWFKVPFYGGRRKVGLQRNCWCWVAASWSALTRYYLPNKSLKTLMAAEQQIHKHTFVSQFSIGIWAFESARKFICLCWAIRMGISNLTEIWMRNHNWITVCDLKEKTYAPAQWEIAWSSQVCGAKPPR